MANKPIQEKDWFEALNEIKYATELQPRRVPLKEDFKDDQASVVEVESDDMSDDEFIEAFGAALAEKKQCCECGDKQLQEETGKKYVVRCVTNGRILDEYGCVISSNPNHPLIFDSYEEADKETCTADGHHLDNFEVIEWHGKTGKKGVTEGMEDLEIQDYVSPVASTDTATVNRLREIKEQIKKLEEERDALLAKYSPTKSKKTVKEAAAPQRKLIKQYVHYDDNGQVDAIADTAAELAAMVGVNVKTVRDLCSPSNAYRDEHFARVSFYDDDEFDDIDLDLLDVDENYTGTPEERTTHLEYEDDVPTDDKFPMPKNITKKADIECTVNKAANHTPADKAELKEDANNYEDSFIEDGCYYLNKEGEFEVGDTVSDSKKAAAIVAKFSEYIKKRKTGKGIGKTAYVDKTKDGSFIVKLK